MVLPHHTIYNPFKSRFRCNVCPIILALTSVCSFKNWNTTFSYSILTLATIFTLVHSISLHIKVICIYRFWFFINTVLLKKSDGAWPDHNLRYILLSLGQRHISNLPQIHTQPEWMHLSTILSIRECIHGSWQLLDFGFILFSSKNRRWWQ